MYKTGYDPTAFVDFFEKIQTLEKRKPGTMSKLFSTHPPTDDRIVKSQKEIADLKAKPEYVVTTSEFNDVKARLAMLENQRRPDKTSDDPNKPTLRTQSELEHADRRRDRSFEEIERRRRATVRS